MLYNSYNKVIHNSRSRPIIQMTADIALNPEIINLDEQTCNLKDGSPVVWYDENTILFVES